MRLPRNRGPVSAALIDALGQPPHDIDPALAGKLGDDEDLQIVLFICYELHYRGFAGVDERWEWQPSLLALRAAAEERFEDALRGLAGPHRADLPADVPRALKALVDADDAPSLARFLQRRATLEQFKEFVTLRSVYHLKEADPHTWGIPRIDGRAKAALIEIQIDEYGGGRLERMHAELFRTTMDRLNLDSTYGAYVDAAPAVVLATSNVISLFGLHRRLRGALLGHLAAFEMTSSLPNRRYGNGLRRLGGDPTATRFYDEHVEADAVHEQIAAVDLCGAFAAAEPARAADVLFGAACCLGLDGLAATYILDRWHRGESALRAP
jgi:hypothetical protein